MWAAPFGGFFAMLLGACLLALGHPASAGADVCDPPVAYPGDDASQAAIAQWMAQGAQARTVPGELPVMAALVESGLKNPNSGDSDQAGYFGMRTSVWDTGVYADFPTHPELQLTWFLDQALAIRAARVVAGDLAFGTDPSHWGEWAADVERPAEQLRGRYQLRLDDAHALIGAGCSNAPVQLAVTNDSLGPATVGSPYSVTLTATGSGTLTWSVASGVLPAGLTLDTDGRLSGTPTTATPTPASLVVKVTDGAQVDTKSLRIDVVEPLAVPQPTFPAAEVGHALTTRPLLATGGRSPYTWALAGAPAWITFDPASALLNGMPTAAGSFPLQASVEDAYGTTATLDLVVTVNARVRISPTKLPVAKVGKLYRATLRTVGGVPPFTWKATSGKVTVWIRIDRKLGILSGRPGKAGAYPLKFTVTDSLGATSAVSLTLPVRALPKRR